MPVIVVTKKAFINAKSGETEKIGENGKNGKNKNRDKNLETNFIQVLYIQYLITF